MADMFGNICTCRKCNGIVHTIKKGDTLYQLSRYYNVTINEIMRANANMNVYNLQVGDEICIPTMPARPEKTYVVNEGDTISDVSKAFGVSFDVLAKSNPALLDVELPEGLILRMPLVMPRDSGTVPSFETDTD